MCDDNYFGYKSRSLPLIEPDEIEMLGFEMKKWLYDYAFPSWADREWICVKHIDLGLTRVIWSWNTYVNHLKIYIGLDAKEQIGRVNIPDEIVLYSLSHWPEQVTNTREMREFASDLVVKYLREEQ